MRRKNPGTLMRIYLDEGDRLHNQPLYVALVERMRSFGIEGATVFKGIDGYGKQGKLRTLRIPDAMAPLPVVLEVVETAERIDAFMPELSAMLDEHGALVTLEQVEVLRYDAADGGPDR